MGSQERSRRTDKINIFDRLLVSQFPQINLSHIGIKLGRGMGHTVYRYGEDKVLKVPIRTHHPPTPEQKKEDYETVKKYFPNSTIETEILTSEKNPNYLLLQRKLGDFENITPQNIQEVKQQFDELISINQRLVREQGISLDFLGKEGMTRCIQAFVSPNTFPQISNIVIERRDGIPRLVIQDFSILKIGDRYSKDLKGARDRLISAVTFGLNQKLILYHFGVSIS